MAHSAGGGATREQDQDLIDALLGITPGDRADLVRRARPDQREHTQIAYAALLHPVETDHVTAAERRVLALYVAELHRHAALAAHYRRLLTDDGANEEAAELANEVAAMAQATAGSGPYGNYREPALAGESTTGPRVRITGAAADRLGPRLNAALEHAHLLVFRPRESSPQAVARLLAAGWSRTGIVTISQLVAFLSYQVRVLHALAVLTDNAEARAGEVDPATSSGAAPGETAPGGSAPGRATPSETSTPSSSDAAAQGVLTYPDLQRPEGFTQQPLGWVPWLEPLTEAELTDRHYAGLVQRARAKNPYFALLARDPEVLGARTRTDFDIFTNTDGGLGRAERELAAAATSRVNGCVFCAHVHARVAARESGRKQDVQRLLDEGVDARFDPEWNAVVDAATALAATPPALTDEHVHALRVTGHGDQAVADALNGAAFFNWANRLMLSLGEPRLPRRR